MKKTTLLKIAIAVMPVSFASAQSTYNAVYDVFQAKCTSCHNATDLAGSLNLADTSSVVYTAIVNANPVNAVALGKQNKLVSPGDPHRSFLLRKCNNGLDADNGITTGEGAACPQDTINQLSNQEVELIRQWIYAGAPETGTVVDTAVINKYYNGWGINNTPAQHPLPTEPGSFQVHVGKIFLDAGTEIEYYLKYDLKLADTVDVNRIELFMPAHSHHFIIYKLDAGAENNFPNSIRIQNPLTGEGSSNGDNTLVSGWQYSDNLELPAGTAYSWPTSTVLDFNHHIFNPEPDSVTGTDIYINVYTQPKHTAAHTMHSDLVSNTAFIIFNNSNDITLSKADYSSGASNMWNIWLLASHTHKYGKDFDIYKRNPNGSKGDKIYEGFFNIDYSFDQGFYDWEHPPTRLFDPLLEINPREGLIQEAVFNNNGSVPVTFGLTTNDEMMLYFIQYTKGASITTGIETNESLNQVYFNVNPNPFASSTNISYNLKEKATVSLEVVDLLGKKIHTFSADEAQASGTYTYDFNPQQYGYSSGIYVVKATINGEQISKRIIQTK